MQLQSWWTPFPVSQPASSTYLANVYASQWLPLMMRDLLQSDLDVTKRSQRGRIGAPDEKQSEGERKGNHVRGKCGPAG